MILSVRPQPAGRRENAMEPSKVLDLKAFVPAEDFALARQFYLDIGFTLVWGDEQACQLKIGGFSFIMQNFHVKDHTGNFMMHLMVEDADAWWKHFEDIGLKSKYPDIMLKPPALQPWGLRVLYLSDPSGVLWHIADRKT